MDIKTEWEEPIPQPEPPKRTVTLQCNRGGILAPATLDDISIALGGVSRSELIALMTHGSITSAYNARMYQSKIYANGLGQWRGQ